VTHVAARSSSGSKITMARSVEELEPLRETWRRLYRCVFRIGVPGYDPALAQLRVGTFVLMKLIEDLCADETVGTVDYGFGDAEYKRRFGTRSWQEEDVFVYATTARGIRINLVRTALLDAAGVAHRVLQRSDAFGCIEREWRRRLSGQSATRSAAARSEA
jgi:CelD/BcsL family acetyltransferase involved in cellulose biosynthesis